LQLLNYNSENYFLWRLTCDVSFTRDGHANRVVGEAEVGAEVFAPRLESENADEALSLHVLLDGLVFVFDLPHEVDVSGVGGCVADQHQLALHFALRDGALRLVCRCATQRVN
jgi:hypothetical protein